MANELGPIYGVSLTESLPIGTSGMKQAMPGRQELQDVRTISERTVAAYEIALSHYLMNREILVKVFGFAFKMSKSADSSRARAGRDMLELLDQCGFKEDATMDLENAISRLRAMTEDNQQTWDLSEKDTMALRLILETIQTLLKERT